MHQSDDTLPLHEWLRLYYTHINSKPVVGIALVLMTNHLDSRFYMYIEVVDVYLRVTLV